MVCRQVGRAAAIYVYVVIGIAGLSPAAVAAQIGSGISGVVRDYLRRGFARRHRRGGEPRPHRGLAHDRHRRSGQYQIIDLRPGDYTVTFTLPGFKTVRREGIRLSTAFTATINVELQVGQLEESITVSGESPLVDVRNSVSQSVMNRETLDIIPTGKDPFAVGQLIPGVTTSTPDVGGTQIMQQPTLQVHGSSNNDNVFMVDNVQIQHIGFGGNQTGFYFNDGLMEEISYQTSSLPAEAPVGGVQINMIPRDGGNQYRRLDLRHRRQRQHAEQQLGRRAARRSASSRANKVKSVYDVNFTFGGPIKRDRLWFFGTYRRWSANNYLGNTFDSRGKQAVDDQRIPDATLRLTWQAARRTRSRCTTIAASSSAVIGPNNWITASINEPVSSVVQTTGLNYIGELKWSSPISNRLLTEFVGVHAAGELQPLVPTRCGPERDCDLRSDSIGVHRRVAAAGHQHGADVHLRRVRVVRHRRAQLQDGRPGAHRLVAGALRNARRHRADRVQRCAAVGAAREQPERPQGIRRQHRHLPPGLVDDSAA